VTFAGALWFPGPFTKARASAVRVDEKARPISARRAGDRHGKAGGMPWEIFAAITETQLDPLFIPIEFETDREARIARLRAPGLGEFRVDRSRTR
jgi:hypothetical protein